MAILTNFLASLPPGHTTLILATVPGFVMTLGGFAWVHVADVRGR